MELTFYLPRRLSCGGKIFTEKELLKAANLVVILAEPGGGKTALMESLARQLKTTAVTAGRFAYEISTEKNAPLVIDAFDELARVDASGIYRLFGQAKAANPTHVYLSSRSSEWDNSATAEFKNCFDQPPPGS